MAQSMIDNASVLERASITVGKTKEAVYISFDVT